MSVTYYFLRVNGDTSHNNPQDKAYYVPGEPPKYPKTHFNYLDFCFQHNIVRVGWPDSGDMLANGANKLAKGYDLDTMKPHEREYLEEFCRITTGSVILVPDRDHSGNLYIATVTHRYWYHHNIPAEPYECSHRVGVEWDRGNDGKPRLYQAGQLNIGKGGFWLRAFQILNDVPTGRAAIPYIDAARSKRA